MLKSRRSLDDDVVCQASRTIAKEIMALPHWKQARRMLLYIAVRNEVGTMDLVNDALHRDVQVLLPRCRPDEPGIMDMACIHDIHQLRPGAYGIPEPDPVVCRPLHDIYVDMALIPGVAFDREGRRLGYGGGYYDRLLGDRHFDRCFLIGLAYDFQIVDELPCEPWDKQVDAIVTEKEVIWPNTYK